MLPPTSTAEWIRPPLKKKSGMHKTHNSNSLLDYFKH